jgi:hypothetical protein
MMQGQTLPAATAPHAGNFPWETGVLFCISEGGAMNRYTLPILVLAVVLVVGCGGAAGATSATATPRNQPATQDVSPLATPQPASPTTTSQDQSITDDARLIEALRAVGAKVELGDAVDQPFFPIPGKVIKISGQDVQVFVFADEAAAQAAAATVPADGSTFQTMIVDWMAPPHFYQRGRIIALYVGADAAILQLLTTLLGQPFAGG